MMDKDSRILVTGASGFLGKALISVLKKNGFQRIVAVGGKNTVGGVDLTVVDYVEHLFEEAKPEVVFHLAARVGGIGANQKRPATFWLENTMMGANILESSVRNGAKQVIITGTTCAYPKYCSVPFKEEDLWNGYPEETNAPYGIAKKSLIEAARAFGIEYGLDVRCPILTNMYGPEDHYDLENSHVIPAMIRKFHQAVKEDVPFVTLWGDGSPTRDFLYVEDGAEALLTSALQPTLNWEPINFGNSEEVSIKRLVEMIGKLTGFTGEIHWDTSRPNGQPRRALDISKALALGWKPKTSLELGLSKTYVDYVNRVCNALPPSH